MPIPRLRRPYSSSVSYGFVFLFPPSSLHPLPPPLLLFLTCAHFNQRLQGRLCVADGWAVSSRTNAFNKTQRPSPTHMHPFPGRDGGHMSPQRGAPASATATGARQGRRVARSFRMHHLGIRCRACICSPIRGNLQSYFTHMCVCVCVCEWEGWDRWVLMGSSDRAV